MPAGKVKANRSQRRKYRRRPVAVTIFLMLPGIHRAMPLIQRSGMWQQPERFVIGCLCVFTAFFMLLGHSGSMGIISSVGATWMVCGYTCIAASSVTAGSSWIFSRRAGLHRAQRARGIPLNSAIALVATIRQRRWGRNSSA